MTSPICLVNGLATTNGVDVSPGSLVTIQLADTAGVNTWEITCIGTDDLLTTDDVNDTLEIIDITAKTATFTMPNDDGYSVILQSRVNRGVDVNGRAVATYTTTFKVATLINSNRTIAANETTESSSTFGWAKPVNEIIRFALSSHLALGGDLSGTYPDATVEKIKGAAVGTAAPGLTDGYFLRATGASTCDWQPVVLTGDVVGTNSANTCTLAGDVTGRTGVTVVEKIKGTTVTTAGGSLPDGYVLRATGVATADWGKVDLANTNSITGTLPLANRPAPVYAATIINNPISITGGVPTQLDLITGNGSISNGLTISTASDNITVVTAGVYRIHVGVLCVTGGSAADISILLYKNGSQLTITAGGQIDLAEHNVPASSIRYITFEMMASLAATDVIHVQYNSNVNTTVEGGTLNMTLL